MKNNALDRNIPFGNNVAVARKERNMTQTDLAESVGVSRNSISSIETGEYCPSARLAAMICCVLEKKFEDLFFIEWEKM